MVLQPWQHRAQTFVENEHPLELLLESETIARVRIGAAKTLQLFFGFFHLLFKD
jgi:hypothetical protein